MVNIIIGIVITLVVIAVGFIIGFGLKVARKTFFCAFPRLAIDGDPNKLKYIHLEGFLFVISNDMWCKDVVYQSEATNMMFQYNLKPILCASEILNNKKPLNIEILDISNNKRMSFEVPHNAKAQAIRFFTKYRELINRIERHKNLKR